jgi:hypothetical protein
MESAAYNRLALYKYPQYTSCKKFSKIEGERNTVFAESVPYLLKTTKKKEKKK